MGPEQGSPAPALPTSGLDRCRGEAIQGTHWRVFSKIPGLPTIPADGTSTPARTTKNVSWGQTVTH